MASAFSHGFIAIVGGKVFTRKRMNFSFWLTSIACSIIPDADVIGYRLGIPYEHMFGHRGFSHSFVFALLLAIAVLTIGFGNLKRYSKEWWSMLVYFFVVTSSHGISDAMTDGGLGVAFFAPFSSERYFFPFRPIAVSPLGIRSFFSSDGVAILLNELLWIWLPLMVLFLIFKVIRSQRSIEKQVL